LTTGTEDCIKLATSTVETSKPQDPLCLGGGSALTTNPNTSLRKQNGTCGLLVSTVPVASFMQSSVSKDHLRQEVKHFDLLLFIDNLTSTC